MYDPSLIVFREFQSLMRFHRSAIQRRYASISVTVVTLVRTKPVTHFVLQHLALPTLGNAPQTQQWNLRVSG